MLIKARANLQPSALFTMSQIYVIITRLKTSGFTDTSTTLHEAFMSHSSAKEALKVHEEKASLDVYYGKPEIIKIAYT